MTPLVAMLTAMSATAAAWWLARRTAIARGASIGALPPLLLLATGAVAALADARGDAGAAAIAVIATVGVAAVADARSGAIVDPLTAALADVALLAAIAQGTLVAFAAGATACGGALLALHLVTRRRGIGLGDVKLAAGIGAGLGAGIGVMSLAAAFIGGGTYGAWLLASGRARRGSEVRFGPFLAFGTAVALLFPPVAG